MDFWAPWCGPCKELAPIFKNISENEKFKEVEFVKINMDDCPEIGTKFSVMSIPSLFIVKNGKVVEQKTGVLKKEEFEAWILKNLE